MQRATKHSCMPGLGCNRPVCFCLRAIEKPLQKIGLMAGDLSKASPFESHRSKGVFWAGGFTVHPSCGARAPKQMRLFHTLRCLAMPQHMYATLHDLCPCAVAVAWQPRMRMLFAERLACNAKFATVAFYRTSAQPSKLATWMLLHFGAMQLLNGTIHAKSAKCNGRDISSLHACLPTHTQCICIYTYTCTYDMIIYIYICI